ncbi:MAG TPA: dipeptidase [Pirellulaceae bacterium]|nr:dipeptidase [Pirellulaceae bacterium]HMO91081.1 dipeptidase [Pirellulaceae bacterium]HMP71180.1 dipeptidase [Pirellulaceae bacterium]
MPQTTADIQTYINENQQQFEQALIEWLKLPSVSTDSAFKQDVRRAAEWLLKRFENIGFKTELIETNGHPIVYAESPPVPGAPVVLVYGHYDVQPPDPLELWHTPPFEPRIQEGKIFARGATDDKGQALTHVLSAEAWIKTQGSLPLQLKFLIEGEEECGSAALYEFLEGKYDKGGPAVQKRLKADVCVISDGSQYDHGQPAVTYGLKGLAYFELRLTGPNRDLHSGAFGGSVANPANALTKILAAMIDDRGRVQVPGFYDPVIAISDEERAQFAALNFDNQEFMRELGIDAIAGEEGYTTLERRWARPTFDINGLWSGYQGEGAKTVLPGKAGAKFSFRLVPNQTPEYVYDRLRSFVESLCPPGIKMELIDLHGAPGVLVPIDNPFMDAAKAAIERGFEKTPVFVRTGGSIPVVLKFKELLDMDTLLLGWGQDDDNMHSPNEKFLLADFHRGIKASAFLWEEIARVHGTRAR